MSKRQTIAIMGAMDAEIKEYIKQATICKKKYWNDFLFFEAELFNKNIVIVKSGVGKVFAAMLCQKLIDEYKPSLIIFSGVAGALNDKLEIGDVVIGKDCVQYDMDVRVLGFSRGTIPYTNYRIFTADKKLRDIALSAELDNNKIIEGRLLTGDQFFDKEQIIQHEYLISELKGDAVDMESASIAQVCTINKLPYLIVRTISNKHNESGPEDFNRFLPVIANNSFKVVKKILQQL